MRQSRGRKITSAIAVQENRSPLTKPFGPIQFQDPRHPDSSALNDRLCQAILDDGRFFISTAQIDGETWLRPCYTNFRTTEQDVTALFEVIKELSQTL